MGVELLDSSAQDQEVLRIMINFQEFERELVSQCKETELLYKYTMTCRNYNEAHSLTEIKLRQPSDPKTSNSFESIMYFDLDANKNNYEVDVFVQTPFDSRPFHIGAYLLNSKSIKIAIRQGLRYIPIKENPYLFAHYWCEYISNTFVYVSIFKSSHNDDDQEEQLFDKFYYELLDLSTFSFVYLSFFCL